MTPPQGNVIMCSICKQLRRGVVECKECHRPICKEHRSLDRICSDCTRKNLVK